VRLGLAVGVLVWWALSRQPILLVVASTFVGFSFLLFGLGLLAFLGKKNPPR
jgi:hypothetical protein